MGPMRSLGTLLAAGVLFAGTASAQLAGWQDAKANLSDYAIGGDAWKIIAVSTDAAFPPVAGSLSLIRSSDGGKTWSPSSFPAARPAGGLGLHGVPSDGRFFYLEAASDAEINSMALYRTSDAGATWELVNPQMQAADGKPIGFIVPGATADLLYASRLEFKVNPSFGIPVLETTEPYVSVDGGKNWHSTKALDAGSGVSIYPAQSDPNVVYATTRDLNGMSAFLRSVDQGASWSSALALGRSEPVGQVTVDRVDASTVYVRTFGTPGRNLVTTDGGATWRDMAPPFPLGIGRWLLADPLAAGRIYAVDEQGAVFESRDHGSTWRAVIAAGITAANGPFVPPAVAVNGERRVFFREQGTETLQIAELPAGFTGLASDLWWNPSESGMGWTISEHASGQAFVVWYRYDAQGNPIWYVMPGGTWTDDSTFHGTLYKTHGPPFFQGPFDPSRVSAAPIGDATLAFSDGSNAVFTYHLTNGEQGAKSITRQLFGAASPGDPPSMADLWWNPRESGWGMAINQQGAKVFAAWFVYDANGEPTWLVMPTAELRAAGGALLTGQYSFGGDLYTTRGPPSTGPFDPAKVVPTLAGTAVVNFVNSSGSLQYSTFGQAGQRDLSRQPF